MQNGPPYEVHCEVAGLLLTSAVPPKSLTTAHFLARARLAKLDVCPISHTNAFGVSKTAPQPRALPIAWVSNAGSSGPYWLFSTIVPERWLFRSVTWMNQPWD